MQVFIEIYQERRMWLTSKKLENDFLSIKLQGKELFRLEK